MEATPKAGTSWQSVREPPHEKEEEQASYTLVTWRKGEGKRGAVCQKSCHAQETPPQHQCSKLFSSRVLRSWYILVPLIAKKR